MNQPPLTIPDVINLNTVINAASQSAKVAWADEDGNVQYGHARHIVKSAENFGFLGREQDVRDGYLRITTRNGLELALPVSKLMKLASDGEFAIYDW